MFGFMEDGRWTNSHREEPLILGQKGHVFPQYGDT